MSGRGNTLVQEQPVILSHLLIRDTHELAEHLARWLGDPDGIAEALAANIQQMPLIIGDDSPSRARPE
jgi:hypothetical protein